jgi:short/branched chain acyl-CoA dehydrogenase
MLRQISRTSIRNINVLFKGPGKLLSQTTAVRSVHSLNTFTEEEDMFRETVAQFAQDVVAPKAREMDEAEAMDKSVVQAMFDTGLMGIETPEELGGAGASFTSAILVVEELAKVDPSVSVMNDVHNTLVNTCIRTWGSKELKEKYLPQLATNTIGAFALSEPSSGSDAFALKSRATKNSDGDYVLSGSKMWITNSAEAGLFIILANLDPSQGYKGITAFVVEKDMGIQIAKKEKKLGIKASSTCVINFDDVVVPKENLLGEEGKGYKMAIECLNEGRIGIAAQMAGLAQGAFHRATNYAFNDRKQFGKLIGDFQGMQFQIAQAATEIEASRLLLYNAARLKEEGKSFVKEAAMAKLYASQVAQKVSSAAVDWMGGVGFTREEMLEKFYRDSKIGTIYEGTSNIQLQTIARLVQKEMTA